MSAQQTQEQALKTVRDQIDSIDREIHRLLNERARCAQRVAEIKSHFDSDDAVFYRPEREAQVLRRVMARNEGPLPDAEVARLFREIMSVCLALEQPLDVVFLGPEATFTQQAAQKHFGHSVRCAALDSLEAVFRDVEAGRAHYGVVPIENVADGMISHTLDLFSRFNVSICGEVEWRSHRSDNTARFLVIGRQHVGPSGDDKTSILLMVHDRPGALYELLEPFRRRDISLTRIESRASSQSRWDTLFYVDFEGHADEAAIAELLAELQSSSVELKLLGSYPKAVL